MTNSGNHGGNTKEETHTAMIFISTNKTHIHPSGYQLSQSNQNVLQIDFAATIASLFNFQLSSKNQGRIISSVLDRFEIANDEHLCHLFKNLFQLQKLISDQNSQLDVQKNDLTSAIDLHYNYVTNSKIKENFLKAKQTYHHLMLSIQQQFIIKTSDRSTFSSLSLAIFLSYFVILLLLLIEFFYNRSASIIFSHQFDIRFIFNVSLWIESIKSSIGNDVSRSQSYIPFNLSASFSHLRFFTSPLARLLAIFLFVLNFVFMGSTSFIEYEHYFWYFSSFTLLSLILLITVR